MVRVTNLFPFCYIRYLPFFRLEKEPLEADLASDEEVVATETKAEQSPVEMESGYDELACCPPVEATRHSAESEPTGEGDVPETG